jgi:hypothetical protein
MRCWTRFLQTKKITEIITPAVFICFSSAVVRAFGCQASRRISPGHRLESEQQRPCKTRATSEESVQETQPNPASKQGTAQYPHGHANGALHSKHVFHSANKTHDAISPYPLTKRTVTLQERQESHNASQNTSLDTQKTSTKAGNQCSDTFPTKRRWHPPALGIEQVHNNKTLSFKPQITAQKPIPFVLSFVAQETPLAVRERQMQTQKASLQVPFVYSFFSASPSIFNSFVLDVSPRISETLVFFTPKYSAASLITSRFAFPSIGGACVTTFRPKSSCFHQTNNQTWTEHEK